MATIKQDLADPTIHTLDTDIRDRSNRRMGAYAYVRGTGEVGRPGRVCVVVQQTRNGREHLASRWYYAATPEGAAKLGVSKLTAIGKSITRAAGKNGGVSPK